MTPFPNNLKFRVSIMSDLGKKCVILFNEISIKSYLEYSRKLDIIVGFEDLGTLGRITSKASRALLFYLRGLYEAREIPLAYFLSKKTVNKSNLKRLIEVVFDKVTYFGFRSKALVCDQGTNNRSAIKLFGATPFFFYKGKKILYCVSI